MIKVKEISGVYAYINPNAIDFFKPSSGIETQVYLCGSSDPVVLICESHTLCSAIRMSQEYGNQEKLIAINEDGEITCHSI